MQAIGMNNCRGRFAAFQRVNRTSGDFVDSFGSLVRHEFLD